MNEIDYIASFLKLDTNNPYILKDIVEIENKVEFIDFMKSNIKNVELDFLNPLQKLTQLKKMYVEDQNKGREEAAMTKSQELDNKFSFIKVFLKQEHEKGLNPKLSCLINSHTKEPYFTKFEIKELERVSTDARYLCRLSDCFELEPRLRKNYIGLIYAQKALPNNYKNVAKIANITVKKF